MFSVEHDVEYLEQEYRSTPYHLTSTEPQGQGPDNLKSSTEISETEYGISSLNHNLASFGSGMRAVQVALLTTAQRLTW